MTTDLTKTPAPSSMTTSTRSVSQAMSDVNVNRLGFFLDGWADLMENMGEKVDTVQNEVYKQLTDREMPDIKVSLAKGHVGLTSQVMGNTRTYITTTTFPGVTTTVYVGKHGKDLFVSWGTFIKRIPNWFVLGIILAWSGLMGFGTATSVIGGSIKINQIAYDVQAQAQGLLGGGFYGYEEEEFEIEPLIRPFYMVVGALGLSAMVSLWWFMGISFALLVLGYYLLQDPFYFVTQHPNMFDAEDIAAMSLSAHKSLLKALDKIGVDTSKLRLKQEFKRGSHTQSI